MISVIFSTNNEMRNNYLQKIVSSLKNQDSKYELIVVDNWSHDWTLDFLKPYAKIFTLKNSNRAERLNLGIKKSSWDIILLHHSVSILPNNVFKKIENSLKKWYKWWWLTHSFDSNNIILKFTSWYSNKIRWNIKWILYLDHMIFSTKESFEKIWWFKNLDIFEDTVLSYDLRKNFWKPIILKNKVITSSRRFTKRWIIKQALLNQYLKLMFHLKSWDKKLNKIYEWKEWFNVNYDNDHP